MTYELVNRRTANTLAVFDNKAAALDGYQQYVEADPDFRFHLRLVVFDDNGLPVEVDDARDLERISATPGMAG